MKVALFAYSSIGARALRALLELGQESRLEIDIDETAPELQRRLEDAVASVLEETWPLIEAGSARRRPQDESKASTFAGRRPEGIRFEEDFGQ